MDQLPDKIKTYARALGGPGVLIPQTEESLKDALTVCQWDSGTMIGNGNDHPVAVLVKLDLDLATHGILQGILNKVDHDAAHGVTVARHDDTIAHIERNQTCIELTLKMGLADSTDKIGKVGLLQMHRESTCLHAVHQQQVLDKSLQSVRV